MRGGSIATPGSGGAADSSLDSLRFTPTLLAKAPLGRFAVETALEHFAIITYWVDPDALRKHLHPRFEPDCVSANGVGPRALVSVVPFRDRDFHFVAFPWYRGSFGQTNYRAYVRDTLTGEQVAWFFGTCLDSCTVNVPRYLWKLPWHRAHMEFDCSYDETAQRYATYEVTTRSNWSPGRLRIEDSGQSPRQLAGFSDLEAGLVLLTHPMKGYFRRRDGTLGSYAIWHERLSPTLGEVKEAAYPLLDRLDLVEEGHCTAVHSVMIQRSVEFAIYLPPHKVE